MAFTPLPKLIPINCTKIYPKDVARPTLSEVLQSDPVKRLFNQPNIVIETMPADSNTNPSAVLNKSIPTEKKNGTSKEMPSITQPQVSILPVTLQSKENNEEESSEEVTFLPSKTEGKSQIALLPIKQEKKDCGHDEPCENIVCDVAVQQYVDQDGASPMLAVDIEDDEINAPVSKHCHNKQCDALSIDHDRCRRALLQLNRFDECPACDICGRKLKTRKARYKHTNCTRKEEYRHNEKDGAQILKERMRERELQMIEAARSKRNDYMDPVTGCNKAMEALKKNEELIIIPKTPPPQQPIITITSIPSNPQPNQQFCNVREVFGKLLPNIPIMLPQQGMLLGKRPGSELNNASSPVKHAKLSDLFANGVTMGSPQNRGQQQFIKLTGVSQSNFIQPVTINDWLMSQAQIVGASASQQRPFLTPIRVVPIANLKSPPSLLHRTQGIPRFCIMPDNTVRPTAVAKTPPIQSASKITPHISIKLNSKVETEEKPKPQAKKPIPKLQVSYYHRRRSEERNGKTFKCSFCPKRFSTDWYFKMHVARHKGEMLFSCKICEQPFSNRYNMKKHMLNDHKEGEVRCEICGQISLCNSALEIHMRTHTGERPFQCEECDLSYRSSTDLKIHQRKRHGMTDCAHCHLPFTRANLKAHLVSHHDMSEEEAEVEFLQSQYENGDVSENFENDNDNLEIDFEAMVNGLVKTEVKEEPNEELIMQDEDSVKMDEMNGTMETEKDANGDEEELEPDSSPGRRSSRRSNSMIQCTICKESFENAELLETHLLDKPEEAVKCDDCGDMFHTQTEYAKHSVICEKAAKKFRVTDSSSAPHQCGVCDEVFSDEKDLHIHASLKPAGYKECDKCNKKFHSNREYDKHFYNFGCVVFKCRNCYRVFKHKKKLNTHVIKMHRHMHKCTECNKQYTNRFNLRYHAKTAHNVTID